MGSANKGAQEHRDLMVRWGVSCPMRPDELLTSWLARTALAFGCDPLVLTDEIWPKWRAWTRDIDRDCPKDRLDDLAWVSGTELDRLLAARLRPVAEKLSEHPLNDRAGWSWILAIGTRNRRRYGGLQYCPACLAEDTHPYYRRAWRFAWNSACDHHGSRLLDRCPSCRAPIEPHRLVYGARTVAFCASCGGNLADGHTMAADAKLLAFQRRAGEVVGEGGALYGDQWLTTPEWFAVVRHLIGLLRRAAITPRSHLGEMIRALGVSLKSDHRPKTGLRLELLSPWERTPLLRDAWVMMAQGPDGLLAAARDAGVSAKGFKIERRNKLPSVLQDICTGLSRGADRGGGPRATPHRRQSLRIPPPRPREQVEQMWARLQRKARMGP